MSRLVVVGTALIAALLSVVAVGYGYDNTTRGAHTMAQAAPEATTLQVLGNGPTTHDSDAALQRVENPGRGVSTRLYSYDVAPNLAAAPVADASRSGAITKPRTDASGPSLVLPGELDAPRGTSLADDAVRGFCSFAGTTAVLMADGTTKAISEIEVGDWVMALDPETGERGPRQVTKLWVHEDTVLDLQIDGDVVTTTEDHPFWNATDGAWQFASDLDAGDRVLTADDDHRPVGSLLRSSARAATAYNLTVDGIHTYFVAIGDDEVLVHNDCFTAADALRDPRALGGLTPSQIDDLARNAGYEVLPGSASSVNPATRYYLPGTNRSVGFRVLPQGVAGQQGIKGGPYLRFFGGDLAGTRVGLLP